MKRNKEMKKLVIEKWSGIGQGKHDCLPRVKK